jgi:DNA uptake protein ComE-like DNA-binding protein
MGLPRPTRTWLRVGTIVWALLPALSFGLLAPVPFAHAAVKLRDRRLWVATAAYAIAGVAIFVPLGSSGSAEPTGGLGESLLVVSLFALMIAATVHAFLLRGRVFAVSPTQAVAAQPAVATALAARQRREQAKAIAARDPALARELRIGRPDLPRQFDDGGLVDVNNVPVQVLVDQLGLSQAQAERVVETRDRVGGFGGPEELAAFAELPEATVRILGDRLLFLGVG